MRYHHLILAEVDLLLGLPTWRERSYVEKYINLIYYVLPNRWNGQNKLYGNLSKTCG